MYRLGDYLVGLINALPTFLPYVTVLCSGLYCACVSDLQGVVKTPEEVVMSQVGKSFSLLP